MQNSSIIDNNGFCLIAYAGFYWTSDRQITCISFGVASWGDDWVFIANVEVDFVSIRSEFGSNYKGLPLQFHPGIMQQFSFK